MAKFYTIYKITNKINGKHYHGMHETNDLDDGYLGSGRLLHRAIKKYGKENFLKEILFVYDNEQEMIDKEIEIVEIGPNSYNLCEGGKGGFGYINRNGFTNLNKDYSKVSRKLKGRLNPSNSERLRQKHRLGEIRYDTFTGKKHSAETKRKIGNANAQHQSGQNNSRYGTCWVYNLTEQKNFAISKDQLSDYLSKGWIRGRRMKFSCNGQVARATTGTL